MYTYEEVLREVLNLVRLLSPDDQLRLVKYLEAFVRQQVKVEPRHSVLEFEGIGQETWKGVDVEKYIDEERNSW